MLPEFALHTNRAPDVPMSQYMSRFVLNNVSVRRTAGTCKANCLPYKIPYKTQLNANILLLLLYGRAFCINNPLHFQPSAEFNGKIFRMGHCCITQNT